MKVTMFKWTGEKMALPSWFVHQGEIELTMDNIQELFNLKINTMFYHQKNKITKIDEVILFVDTRRFTQR